MVGRKFRKGRDKFQADKIYYSGLKNWKYRLEHDLKLLTEIKGYYIQHPMFLLTEDGWLTIKKGYCWDGPSGIFTIHTRSFMRSSCGHDAIYQMIRMGVLPLSCKPLGDDLLIKVSLQDKMWKTRTKWVRKAVDVFGGSSCVPGSQELSPQIYVSP